MPDSAALHRVLGAILQARVKLELDTAQLCYLILLRVYADDNNVASLHEDVLIALYLQVCELVEPDAVNPRKRATHAIQHLRDHRLLRRVDGAGLVRAGDYTLTRLATTIADFFVEDESLTRESLVVLTRALISQLSSVLVDARKASSAEVWLRNVVEPVRVTVSDLVSGIERRQRGMDAQQEDVRERIEALLQEDWFGAVADCEHLLEDTSTTLRELNEILLRDCAHIQGILQDIEDAATDDAAVEAVVQVQKVQEHLDRVSAWGGARQRAWSDYYQFVQRYLRDVVRLDPDRAVSQRLRDQLASWLDRPFTFVRAGEPSIRLLREDQTRVERPPVTRGRKDRDREPELVPPDPTPITLEDQVDEALNAGSRLLSEVLENVLPKVSSTQRYRVAGRVAELVAAKVHVSGPRERQWRPLSLPLEVEEWELGSRREV